MMKFKFILMFAMIFLAMPLVMGAEFDNRLTYSDDDTKVTVKNWFGLGGDIAEMELITPRVNRVFAGEDRRVMIWKVNTFDNDYVDGFGTTEIIDIARGNDDLDFHFEVAVYEDVEVLEYDDDCEKDTLDINGSTKKGRCTRIVSGSHLENKLVRWDDFNGKTLPKGEITIALTTDVENGDHYDAIPTLFGRPVDRWAEWTAGFNDNLILAYEFDERTGTNLQENVSGIFNGTAFGWENQDWVDGIIRNGANFSESTDDQRINISAGAFTGMQNFTISLWFNDTNQGASNEFIMHNSNFVNSDDIFMFRLPNENTQSFAVTINGIANKSLSGDIVYNLDSLWNNLVGMYNGTAIT